MKLTIVLIILGCFCGFGLTRQLAYSLDPELQIRDDIKIKISAAPTPTNILLPISVRPEITLRQIPTGKVEPSVTAVVSPRPTVTGENLNLMTEPTIEPSETIKPSPTKVELTTAEIGSKDDKSPIFVIITIALLLLIIFIQGWDKIDKKVVE